MNISIALSPKDIARFWKKVNKKGSDECWIWTGSKDIKYNYGSFHLGLGTVLAHRVSWTIQYGAIPGDLKVLHKCDNPPCVNPHHLFTGTNSDNMQDMAEKGRSTFGRFRGEDNGNSKLTPAIILEIRNLLEQKVSLMIIARKFGIGKRTVVDIKQRKTWYWLE